VGEKAITREHIAIYLPSLHGGGAERVMVTLANGFAQRGHLVDLVLASAEGPYLERVDPAVRVVDLKAKGVLRSLPSLVRYLRNERPDSMLAALSHANLIAILARAWARVLVRLVVSERSTPSQVVASHCRLPCRIVYSLIHWLYPYADGVVAVSEGVANDLAAFARLPRNRIHTIYNPFDIEWIQKLACEPLDHPWFAPNQPPVVLGVGRLTEAKDFPTLLRSFAIIKRTQRPMRLIILGEGELRSELEVLAQSLGLTADEFSMLGFVTNPFAYYSRCGVFVLSSRFEGLPGVLIEAMVAGAQVVAMDCPSGPREILEDGLWGGLVPVGDVDALSVAIIKHLDIENIIDTSHRVCEFKAQNIIESYLKILKSSR